MPIVNLTQQFVDTKLQCPPDKRRIEFVFHERTGLYIEVRNTSPGQGSYYLRSKIDGKTRHTKIGRTTDISAAQAKEKAKLLKAEIALGADPGQERKAKQTELTYSEFFESHFLPYIKTRIKSWKKHEEYYRLRTKKVFGDTKLSDIKRHDIQSLHTRLRTESGILFQC